MILLCIQPATLAAMSAWALSGPPDSYVSELSLLPAPASALDIVDAKPAGVRAGLGKRGGMYLLYVKLRVKLACGIPITRRRQQTLRCP